MSRNTNCSTNNVYRLEGRVFIVKTTPSGFQYILTMFVSNLAPITIIAGAAQPALSQAQIAILLQNTMFMAGITTMARLYPIWRIGSKLPVIMGVSFTFVTVFSTIAANYGYPVTVGTVLIGSIFEGILGLLAKHWRRIITPAITASVATAIGLSFFAVGTRSSGGGYADDFGSAQNLIPGTTILLTYLLRNIFAKEYLKQLSVLAGLIVGYAITIFLGKVDLGLITFGGIISFPHPLPSISEFHTGVIISAYIILLVSAAETISDTLALASDGLNHEITGKKMSGSLACNGYASALSTVSGCLPTASFSQDVGLVAMAKVVNRLIIMTGAAYMILAGLLPPVGNSFVSLPQVVLGGCTIMMFGTILTSSVQMIVKHGSSQRNIVIVSLSLATGIGFTTTSEVGTWNIFLELVQSIFPASMVATVFVVFVFLSLAFPRDMDTEAPEE